jgi:hypothetical protein
MRQPRFTKARTRRGRRLAVGVATLAVVAVVAVLAALGIFGMLGPGALTMLPALLLAVALFAGRYPGERLIERWARSRPRPRAMISRALAPELPSPTLLRGGRLIAVALAGRAPPVLAAG